MGCLVIKSHYRTRDYLTDNKTDNTETHPHPDNIGMLHHCVCYLVCCEMGAEQFLDPRILGEKRLFKVCILRSKKIFM